MRNTTSIPTALVLAAFASLTLLAADPTPAPPVAIVHIKNFAYAPRTLIVKPGDTVRFINDDDVAHTVTANDKSFDSGDFEKGRYWNHTFKKAGTYNYFCADHPSMKGSITAQDASDKASPAAASPAGASASPEASQSAYPRNS